jgi:hypothetical protein
MRLSTYLLPAVILAFSLMILSIMPELASAFTPGIKSKGQDYSFGSIASVQSDESGKPIWIITGDWKGNILSNVSAANASDITFSANVRMIMTNGSSGHSHAITNFNVTNISEENGTRTFNGTTALNLPDKTVQGVPTSIKVLGEGVISIWIDPTKVEKHYGNNPIFGVVANQKKLGQSSLEP